MHYDLEERVSIFAENILDFAQKHEKNGVIKVIIFQLARSATSIGANYMEANCAESKKDFIHKIAICNKEIKESSYWLRLSAKILKNEAETINVFRKESLELNKIFSKILISSKINESLKKLN